MAVDELTVHELGIKSHPLNTLRALGKNAEYASENVCSDSFPGLAVTSEPLLTFCPGPAEL